MRKDKINFKLVNMTLVLAMICLLYLTGGLWMHLFNKAYEIIFPFALAFITAYALYPITMILRNNKVPKTVSNLIVISSVLLTIVGFILLVVPLLTSQLTSLFDNIMVFVKDLSMNYNLNLGPLQDTLDSEFQNILAGVGTYVSNGAVNIINGSLEFVTTTFIVFSLATYFLFDMDKIRLYVKKYTKRKSLKNFNYLRKVDDDMKNYLSGFVRISVISFFEYGIIYYIIGHPSAMLLAVLAAVANLIPYFGGMINNTIAAITAFAISPALFFKTMIAFALLSVLDGYVINPLVFGKTNKVHPVVVISAVFIGGAVAGIVGVIISLPIAIIIITTYKHFKRDINEKIVKIKEDNN